MRIEEWFNSGMIEAYVLGELSKEEILEVEEMAQRHPEVKAEITQTEIALEQLSRKAAVKPSPTTKDDLFSKIEYSTGEAETKQIRKIHTDTTAKSQDNSIGKRPWQYLAAAAVSLLVLSSVLAIYYRSQWQSAESQLANFITQEQELSQQYQALRSDYQVLQQQTSDVFTNPNFQQVRLQGTDGFPSAFAVVYWNDNTDQVYLNPAGLPKPDAGKQYQLWGIVDGQPASAGVFDQQDELLTMQLIDGAAAFAITLEPKGGSKNPTMEAMYVLGEV